MHMYKYQVITEKYKTYLACGISRYCLSAHTNDNTCPAKIFSVYLSCLGYY